MTKILERTKKSRILFRLEMMKVSFWNINLVASCLFQNVDGWWVVCQLVGWIDRHNGWVYGWSVGWVDRWI